MPTAATELPPAGLATELPPAGPATELAAALKAQARAAARDMIKRRARAYARHPRELDAIAPGLADAAPEALIAAGAALLRAEAATPRRWFGFGGEVAALNARAMVLLGRTRRRSQPRVAKGAV